MLYGTDISRLGLRSADLWLMPWMSGDLLESSGRGAQFLKCWCVRCARGGV